MAMKRVQISEEVEQVYRWLAAQLGEHTDQSQGCLCCGSCCDFDKFGHRLFVTTPEMVYFLSHIKPDNRLKMANGVCPYLVFGECSVHKYRFAGCRIFFCKADNDLQSQLSEDSLGRLKDICRRYSIPYRYQDLAAALRDIADLDSWLHDIV